MGTVYTGVTQDVKRSTLGVPGGPFNVLLPRSSDFDTFWTALSLIYSPPDIIGGLTLLQGLWDRSDPGGYMRTITKDPPPNTPVHQVLVQYGKTLKFDGG